MEFNCIEDYIDKSKVKYNESMSKHTTLKVGGPADIFVMPENEEDIINVLKCAKINKLDVTVIGNGSKLLVKDKGIRGIVIKLGSRFSNFEIKGEYIVVNSGMALPRLSLIAKDNGLSGLEFACGIPGNVGGAIYMNAGAYGSEMSNIVEEVTYIDENLEFKNIKNEELKFGYRTSIFKKDLNNKCVIISVKLKLKKEEKSEIENVMKQNSEARKQKQPLEFPNAGSTFKRPEGYFVGKLIDDLNLKGYSIGNAQISTKHSGFIVNLGGATAKDVTNLIDYIKECVLKAYNVKLEEEIIILGEGD